MSTIVRAVYLSHRSGHSSESGKSVTEQQGDLAEPVTMESAGSAKFVAEQKANSDEPIKEKPLGSVFGSIGRFSVSKVFEVYQRIQELFMRISKAGMAPIQPDIIEAMFAKMLPGLVENAINNCITQMLDPIVKLETLKRKEYLTEQEVGTLYSISPASIRSDRSRGLGPCYIKDGRRVLYSQKELARYYEMRMVKTKSRR